MWGDEPAKRTLGIRERQILWERAEHRCENPLCKKKLDFTEMQVGHKTAASKGGRATLGNCVCLCYKCNKLQGTDSWNVFLKKMGKQPETSKTKDMLKNLSIRELKFLAKKHRVKVKGRTEESLFSSYQKSPSKSQYVKTLAKKISEKDIDSGLKEIPPRAKKKRKRKKSSYW